MELTFGKSPGGDENDIFAFLILLRQLLMLHWYPFFELVLPPTAIVKPLWLSMLLLLFSCVRIHPRIYLYLSTYI